jgi:hypothetical protein
MFIRILPIIFLLLFPSLEATSEFQSVSKKTSLKHKVYPLEAVKNKFETAQENSTPLEQSERSTRVVEKNSLKNDFHKFYSSIFRGLQYFCGFIGFLALRQQWKSRSLIPQRIQ